MSTTINVDIRASTGHTARRAPQRVRDRREMLDRIAAAYATEKENPALRNHHTIVTDLTNVDGVVAVVRRVTDQRTIDRLKVRQQISERQWFAAAFARDTFELAGMMQRVVASYDGIVVDASRGGLEAGFAAREDANLALGEIMGAAGKRLAPVLMAVVCLDQTAEDWARSQGMRGDCSTAGMTLLRLALDQVADHFKF